MRKVFGKLRGLENGGGGIIKAHLRAKIYEPRWSFAMNNSI